MSEIVTRVNRAGIPLNAKEGETLASLERMEAHAKEIGGRLKEECAAMRKLRGNEGEIRGVLEVPLCEAERREIEQAVTTWYGR